MTNKPLESDVVQARRPKASAADRWRGIVARQGQSGLRPVDFCRREGIPQSSFFAWRRKLGGKAASVAAAKAPAVPFAPVTVKAEAAREMAASHGRDALELRLGGRRRVIVRDGFDPRLLARVVRVLEGLDAGGQGVGGAS